MHVMPQNLVLSMGVNAVGKPVQLRGCFLMVVVGYAAHCLRSHSLPVDVPHSHDKAGNIVLLDPTSCRVYLIRTTLDALLLGVKNVPSLRTTL